MSDYNLISCVESVMIQPTELYGRFVLGNFTKGQSLTIANALRRCLLSELIGCSICFVEIRGIEHEYESLPGMKDSVLDLLFNLRQVTLKSDKVLFNSQLAYLNVLGPGVVRARDLKLPYFITVVDPNQYIATLSPNATLVLKLIINCGKTYLKHSPGSFDYHNYITKLKQRSWFKVGYQPQNNLAYSSQWIKQRLALAENKYEATKQTGVSKSTDFSKASKLTGQKKKTNRSKSASLFNNPLADHLDEGFTKQKKVLNLIDKKGYFPIDAIFAPILKANYTIEATSPTKEKIYFEIWTNGSIEPRQAIHKAAKALIELFLPLQGFQTLTSKANTLTHFKSALDLKQREAYAFKNNQTLKLNSNKMAIENSERSSTKQNTVEMFMVWLKAYVKKYPKIALKIVKKVLKPKTYSVDVKFGVVRQNLVRPLKSLTITEKMLSVPNPLLEHRLEDRIIVKSKAKAKNLRLKTKKKQILDSNYIDVEKKLTRKQRLNKQRLEEQKQQQKEILQKSVIYFKYLILNVDLSQIKFPYYLYLKLKTNGIHNIEQLINVSSDQLKTMLKLNSKQITFIQVTLKNYVLDHLID